MTLEECTKKLLIKEPFYGLFLLGLKKHFGTESPTACVYRDGINCALSVNKEYWDSLPSDELRMSVLLHELNHILFKHMLMLDDFEDPNLFNISADCEVNSYISNLQVDPYCYAARYGFNNFKGTKFYYENIPNTENGKNDLKNTSSADDFNVKYVDDHGTWKDFKEASEATKDLISSQLDYQAKNVAEQVKKTCGNIPGQFSEYIESLFKERPAVFNWKSYFRRLLGNSIIMFLKNTKYKPSKRFEGQQGLILKSKPKVLVAVDTSGSVSNNELSDFFTEIEHLYKSGVGVTVIEFDTTITNKFEYKGKKTNIEINGRGGTDATDAFKYYVQHPDYSTFVVFTDGYLSLDLPKCKNVIWVITSSGQRTEYPGKSVFIPKQ